MAQLVWDWSELAFGNKKELEGLDAIFVAAPREISAKRFTQLIKTYLPSANIVLGISKEDYVLGFEDQPQFKTLQTSVIQEVIDRVNRSNFKHKVYVLRYFQRETAYIFDKLKFKKVLLINGSWKYAYHTQAPYYVLANRHTPYSMLSPFLSEQEAKGYADHTPLIRFDIDKSSTFSSKELLELAGQVAKHSYDYNFQTGAVLAKALPGKTDTYELIDHAYNKVVPFQTYAMHYGAAREAHFSPPNDLNHYDTVHAEVKLLLQAAESNTDLTGGSLFINLLPCPTCSRMLSETKIKEIVFSIDHSGGYANTLLQAAGKQVRSLT